MELGLTLQAIDELAEFKQQAEIVRHVLDSVLMTPFPPDLEFRVERREARIKSLSSLIEKKIARTQSFAEIEDAVGYRFVVRKRTDKEKLVRHLIQKIAGTGLCSLEEIYLKTIRTSRGYVADHITFRARICNLVDGRVGVELQVRSILEDTWARISQTMDYKKNNVVNKRNEKILKKVQEALDDIENNL